MNTIPGLGKRRKSSIGTSSPTRGLNTLDREREASMADEGGASGMFMETQRDEYEPYDGPVLEWYQSTRAPRPVLIAAGVVLGLVGIAAISVVAVKLARA